GRIGDLSSGKTCASRRGFCIMLLELRDLALSLERSGIRAEKVDDRLVPFPKQPAFQVDVDDQGQVTALRVVDTDRTARLRKFECSKGGMRESTPGFNVAPLFRPRPGENETAYRKEVGSFQKALKKGAMRPEESRCRLEQLRERSEPGWGD